MRTFEKISFQEFKIYFGDNKELYESYNIPIRKNKNSPGYDFELIETLILKPGVILKIPLGIKVNMNSDEFFMLVQNPYYELNYDIRMQNPVQIIDKEYYNNSNNEGHLFIIIRNEGINDIILKKGDRLLQGIFIPYHKTDDEQGVIKI